MIRESVGQRLHVLGVAVTGSGRHLAAHLLGADLVKNEITCQLRAAVEIAPEVDTIFEIGGQDSKYIHVRDGHIDDFVMNKICAAGTGSFLEEQADHLGVAIVDEFSRLAAASAAPADLGCQCTVFMHSEVVAAQRRGASTPDLCAGLAYSVARNYLDRVVAGAAHRALDHVPGRGGEQSVRRGRVPADPRDCPSASILTPRFRAPSARRSWCVRPGRPQPPSAASTPAATRKWSRSSARPARTAAR